jgi:hypothetical protein
MEVGMGASGSSVRGLMAVTVEGMAVGGVAEGGWSGGLPRGMVAGGGGCVENVVGTGTGGGGSLMVGRTGVGNTVGESYTTDPGLVQNVLAAAGC